LIVAGAFSCVLYDLALIRLFPGTAQDLRGLLQRRKKKEEKVDTAPVVPSPT